MKNHAYDVASDKMTETLTKFLDKAKTKYDLYVAQRDEEKYDETMKTLDGMWRCFQNDALADSESQKAMGTSSDGDDDPKANMASVRFFRKANQDMATISSIVNSQELPYQYRARTNPNIFGDEGIAKDSTAVATAVSKFTWQNNGSSERITDWALQIGKYGNVPVRAIMHEKREEVFVYDHDKKKSQWKEMVTEHYPSWEVLPYDSCYGDIYGGPMEKQEVIIVLTPVTQKAIHTLLKTKKITQEAYDLFKEKKGSLNWDGAIGAEHKKEQKQSGTGTNEGPSEVSNLFLQWEVYAFVPISKDGMWDEDENEHILHYSRVIGNDLGGDGVVLSLESNFEPDSEIPIRMTWAIPDDIGLMYHMAPGLAVRAMYAVECTLWNMMIDNAAAINDPMLLAITEAFAELPDDLRYKRGQILKIEGGNSLDNVIKEFAPNNIIESMARVVGLLQDEQQVAGNTNDNAQGQGFGGRQSATENMNINRLSRQPELVMANYAVKQLLGFLGRKNYRYTQAYMTQAEIEQIANEKLDHPVFASDDNDDDRMFPKGMEFFGMFDVDMSMLDEKQADIVESQQELTLLQAMGNSPALMASETHSVDVGAWLKSIFRRRQIKDADIIIGPGGDNDARLRQREELRVMTEQRVVVPVGQQDNDTQHIAEINAFLAEWKPVTGIVGSADFDALEANDQREASGMKAIIETLVIPHLEQHKAAQVAKQQSRAQMVQGAMQAAQGGEQALQTGGQAAGNQAAGALGAAQ